MNEALAVLAFHQVYDPVGGNIALSALIAGVPLYIVYLMLAVLRLPAWLSALVAMLSAAVLAALVWRMPVGLDVSATTEGMANGLWPISWIVLNAVFFHNLTIASGDFDVIRRSLTRLTGDRRLARHGVSRALLRQVGSTLTIRLRRAAPSELLPH